MQSPDIDAQVDDARVEVGQQASQISREIVQMHAHLYGRGPTRAKTYVSHDYAVTVLEEIFIPAEKTLIAAGRAENVHATRSAFQDAVADEFIGIVERALGRKVRAFTSHTHIEQELAVEFFLLDGGTGQDADYVGDRNGDGSG